MSSSAEMFQARSAALSASSSVVLFPVKSAQLSMRLFAVEVVEEVEGDLVQDLLAEEDLGEVVLVHLEVAVDLDLLEVMAVLDPLVELPQEVVVDMEQKDGRDGQQILQVEVPEVMGEDQDIAVDQVEDLVEVVDIQEVVEMEDLVAAAVDLVAAAVDLEEMEGDLEEVLQEAEDALLFHANSVELYKNSSVAQFLASSVDL